MKDVNDFFETQKNFLIEYHGHLKEATTKADKMTMKHKGKFKIKGNWLITTYKTCYRKLFF